MCVVVVVVVVMVWVVWRRVGSDLPARPAGYNVRYISMYVGAADGSDAMRGDIFSNTCIPYNVYSLTPEETNGAG
ncbi:hypothetical protein F5Y15DRAFT_385474 [Xylariaceae sp. FL0016]|nr:hypothetical protein F5Y15DRAFT_385474 [Xylariaceae sp. FL0016]